MPSPFLPIISALSGLLSAVSKYLGVMTAYILGKRSEALKNEKKSHEHTKEIAERWKNRPRTVADAIERMRQYRKPK